MKYTAQAEYGLRCLLQIARPPDGFATIHQIADLEGLTPAYVAKLLRILRTKGVVDSTRGQKGGYRLSAPADTMSLARVLAALGGRLYTEQFCRQHSGAEGTCVHTANCSIRSVWSVIDRIVVRTLGQTMLSELLNPEPNMNAWVEIQLAENGEASVAP